MKVTVRLPSVILAAGLSLAPAAAQQLRFEAASVKRINPGQIHNSFGPGTVVLRGDTLKIILMEAFQVKAYQIAGPSWLDEDFFEIVARLPEGATREQIPAMLQALLAERFQLTAHKDNRERPVYALVLDRNGPKFKEANFRRGERPLTLFRTANPRGYKGSMTMATLARFLSGDLDRPVQDFTGLGGTYEIDLSWTPEPGVERASTTPIPFGPPAVPDAEPRGPGIFTAIRETLGLRLEARKEPVEMLVIDRLERVPAAN